LLGAALASVALALAAAGCGGSSGSSGSGSGTEVILAGGPEATGGKALSFVASTEAPLRGAGGVHALELRGVDADGDASFDEPDFRDPKRCTLPPCQWDVLPDKAATYEFRAFLVDVTDGDKTDGESAAVEAVWTAPPRPQEIELLINGKRQKITPLTGGDDYVGTPVGKLKAVARWATDARGTGYYVVLATTQPKKQTHATCRTGTTCSAPQAMPIGVDEEMTWEVRVVTVKGDRVVDGAKVCLVGRRD
jgi:hypothetical protein